ncbi:MULTISPECIES: hypothetical protein [Enterobacterales]|uniref:Adhesin n=1 Tax=Hafnia alvei TaxID=569 RepID=A0A1C6Z1C3_HAFAL|nr:MULTISPECIES: hypothetical protein [Enterobacterales]MDW5509664.1 hypothetical protein [Serratia proteamaculans]NLS55183.1 hypothetical protein [Hafnia alvei]SCM52926.1 hypothetical protein BN1044_02414 [Hafnia alvei]
MKKLLSGTVLLAGGMFSVSVLAEGIPCGGGPVVFYGKTTSHKKAVEICKFSDEYNYIFGKVDDEPDININVPVNQVQVEDLKGHAVGITTITIPNGNVKYEIGYTQPEGTEGGYAITVWQNNKTTTVVKLDSATVTNNISNYADSGEESDTNVNPNTNDTLKLNVSAKYSDAPAGRYYFWKYQLISNVDKLTINKIIINNGRCSINEKKRTFFTKAQEQNILNRTLYGSKARLVPEGNEKARTDWDLNMGGIYYFTVSSDSDYGKCRPREALIETNKGISTFRWKN